MITIPARQSGATMLQVTLAVLGVGLVAILGLMIWAWKNPLAIFEWSTRAALEGAGFERRSAEVAGGDMVWWEKGSGEPLVFLHGAGDQAGTWSRVAPRFADGWRVLLLDLPGHGESAPAAGPLPMSRVAAGVEAFLASDAVGRPAVLVGNSMGAWLAMLAAERVPERVARVVAVNGGALTGEPTDLTLTPDDRAGARRLMGALRDESSPPPPDFLLDDIVERSASGPIGRMMSDLEDLTGHLMDGRLGDLRVPVDLLWGASDGLMPLAYARRMEAELPAARLTVIETCGHIPQNECPERFHDALAGVLGSEPPQAAAPEPEPASEGTPLDVSAEAPEEPGADG